MTHKNALGEWVDRWSFQKKEWKFCILEPIKENPLGRKHQVTFLWYLTSWSPGSQTSNLSACLIGLYLPQKVSQWISPVSKQIWTPHSTSIIWRFSPYKACVFTGKMCLPNLTTSPGPKRLVVLISTPNSSRCRDPSPSAFSKDIRSQIDAVFYEEHCQHSYPMHRNDGRFPFNGSMDSQTKFMFLFPF